MYPEEIDLIRGVLPREMPFHYYPDRDSAWLLAQCMGGDAAISALKARPCARLLTRPLIKPMVAACGGTLRHRDMLAVAHADRAMRMDGIGPVGNAALETVFATGWQDYRLSFAKWTGQQMSRPGGNLVVQLSFPSDHAELLGQHCAHETRGKYEFGLHPVRRTGRPTLAWARLDIDLERGEALIEEVQSDWLRYVIKERHTMEAEQPQSRTLKRLRAYENALLNRYARLWPGVMMLAVLTLLRDEFAIRDVWMHQPQAGAVLKGIGGTPPPRSLYTDLPRRFCFEPMEELPFMLVGRHKRGAGRGQRACAWKLRDLRRVRGPVSWRLRLE